MRRLRHACAVLLCLALPALPAATPGTLWEVRTTMEAGGMKMPGQTSRYCAPAEAEGPEAMGGADNRCTMTDVRRSPGRFSYTVRCPEGSGTGEMVYDGKDSYTSRMTMTMDGETMVTVQEGRRLGDCDASAVNEQVAAIQGEMAAAQAQSCAAAVDQLLPYLLTTLGGCEPQYQQQLCERLRTKEGYRTVAMRQPTGNQEMDGGTLPNVARFCNTTPESLQSALCSSVAPEQDLDFIGGNCPDLSQPIAQRECAGRSPSSPPAPQYVSFCNTYARNLMQQPGDQAPGGPPSTQDVLKDGAKRLRGLIGR